MQSKYGHADEKHWAWKGDKLTNYFSIHAYLRKFKTGVCAFCGEQRKTHNAVKRGKPHARNRDNYHELCVPCHIRYDATDERAEKWHSNLAKSPTHLNPVKAKQCLKCLKEFTPARKQRRFCSNSCSALWRVEFNPTAMIRAKDPVTNLYLALNSKE